MHSIPYVYYSAVVKVFAWINHEGHYEILESSSYSQGCCSIIYNNALILSIKGIHISFCYKSLSLLFKWTSTPSVSSPTKTEMIKV